MKRLVALAAGCALLAACGNKDTKSTEKGGNPLNAPADYLGAVNQAQKAAARAVDLAAVQNAIGLFQAQEDRYPRDLNELVQKRYLQQVPQPPAGSRLTYNPATGEVKMVRQ
jgi:hypothetical protein